jgi:hypothetical protein
MCVDGIHKVHRRPSWSCWIPRERVPSGGLGRWGSALWMTTVLPLAETKPPQGKARYMACRRNLCGCAGFYQFLLMFIPAFPDVGDPKLSFTSRKASISIQLDLALALWPKNRERDPSRRVFDW